MASLAGCKNPVGAEFNFQTMRMEMTDFIEVIFNPVTQVKFVHTVAGWLHNGCVIYHGDQCLLHAEERTRLTIARRSFTVAGESAFGMAAIVSTVLGDESEL